MSKLEDVRAMVREYGVDLTAISFNLTRATVERYMRQRNKPVDRGTIVLAIPDTHCPFMHKSAVDFLVETYSKYKCNKVVHLGDLADCHSISRHQSSADADGAVLEYDKMLEQVGALTSAFPEATLLEGNHDSISARQAATLGIPRVYLRSLKELYHLPDTWSVAESAIIDDVKYYHGLGAGGVHGAYNAAIRNMRSIVIGHTHTAGGVRYHANDDKLIFGAASGCLIDIKRYAFEYQRAYTTRPILGCTVVRGSEEAVFVPMNPGRYA